jgi:hypothetical protein
MVLPYGLFWRVIREKFEIYPYIEVRLSTPIGEPIVRLHTMSDG